MWNFTRIRFAVLKILTLVLQDVTTLHPLAVVIHLGRVGDSGSHCKNKSIFGYAQKDVSSEVSGLKRYDKWFHFSITKQTIFHSSFWPFRSFILNDRMVIHIESPHHTGGPLVLRHCNPSFLSIFLKWKTAEKWTFL